MALSDISIEIKVARCLALSLASLVTLSAPTGAAEDAGPRAAAHDPWERGASALPEARPRGATLSACGSQRPVCVHGVRGDEARVLETLHDVEGALAITTGALRLPRPDADVVSGALDVYLVDRVDDDAKVLLGARDPLATFDRASAFIELPRSLSGCAREVALQRAVLHASLFRASPATSEGVALATTSHLARLAVPCAAGHALSEITELQNRPTRPIADGSGARFARGSSVFFDWADARFGAEPGGLVRASWALTPTTTPTDHVRFTSRPDVFDVFRTSFKEVLSVGSSLEDLFLRFAGARPAFGASADATTLLSSRTWGDAAKVRVDLTIDWPTKPRRFVSAEPVGPTGASYVAVRRRGAPVGSRLRLEAEWEEHARFRWMVLKLDARGAVTGSVLVPATPRATSAQATIAELDAVDTVLVVAMNAGDRDRPFDPDDGEWEPHAYLLTLASE